MASGTLPTVVHLISVTGKVSEYAPSGAYLDSASLTEISASAFTDLGVSPTITPVQIGGAGGLLPPTSDMAAGTAFWESLESMKVTMDAPHAVSATDATYLKAYVAVDNGAGSPIATGVNGHGGLTVTGGAADYGNTDVVGGDFNPESIQIDVDTGILSGFTKPVVDVGAQFSDVNGIMSYAYGVYQVLVDSLNSQASAAVTSAHYAYIDNPFINNNATGTANGGEAGGNIRNAYIYRSDRVSFVEGSLQTIGGDDSAITTLAGNADQAANQNNPFYSARPSLVATFAFSGQNVTVIDNHFSSKGGSGVLEGTDPTPLDAYEDKCAAQAQAVNTYVDSLLASNADARIVVAGDLNEFQFEEPLKVLEGTATVSG